MYFYLLFFLTLARRARANKTARLKKKAFIHFHDRIVLAGSGETRERSETVKVLFKKIK